MHFGTDWVQGAMRLSKPSRLVLVYTQAMLSFLLFRPEPRNVLLVGLGSASLVRWFRHHMPDAHLTVVEINRDVIQVAHQFFKLPPDDDRLDVQVGDGYSYMHQPGPPFDTILVDGYDHRARPGKLESLEFYRACRNRLAPQGVLVANVFGRVRGHGQTKRHLGEAFGRGVVLLPSSDSKNVLISAFADPPTPASPAQLRERAVMLQARYDIPMVKWVHALQRANRTDAQSLIG
ncbi:MAG: fused MFS/spermidine synthase [Betaproteobacteria bacterium]